ncbi:MAG: hypothetical protein IPI46_12340 [Bacteroidetes bacterium]|nr:hypothetical protein [Bacteroidota bacterium]
MEVYHQFHNTNKFYPTWEVDYIFLGTFNPVCGEQLDYYYRRKSNGFWNILKAYFDPNNEYNILTYIELESFVKAKKIGCIDVIKKVTFPDDMRDKICGKGYSDQTLFTVTNFKREYTFEEIKEFLIKRKVEKVFSTWGKRDSPSEFLNEVNNFVTFCDENSICFTPLPSPSGRCYRGVNIPIITNEWGNRITNDFCKKPL